MNSGGWRTFAIGAGLVASAIFSLVAGCGAENAVPIAPSRPVITEPIASASASAPHPSASAAAPPRHHVGPKPGEPAIACDDEVCRAEDEACCPRTGTCEKRVVAKNASSYEELGPQLRICEGAPKLCGDSSQCDGGERCCSSYFTSDADVVRCSVSCDYSELCSEGGRCKTPRTSCLGGTCERTDVLCGKTKCAGSTAACCFDEGKLVCAAECKDGMSVACTKSADCPGSGRCQAQGGRTYCSAVVDIANAQQVCTSDAECKALDICRFSGNSKPFCNKGSAFGICGCR